MDGSIIINNKEVLNMKRCFCGSKEFSITQMVQVKFIVDGNLNIVGNELRNPNYLNGLIICAECGKEYTENSFKELDDIK